MLNIITVTERERDKRMKKERKWEELNTDCLVKVLERVGLESLILAVPFVCKSWYKASLIPDCWKILHFPEELLSDEPWIWSLNQEYRARFMNVTGFVNLVVSRSHRSAVSVLLPSHCTSEALEFVSNECPALKALGMPSKVLYDHGELIQKLVSKWKDLQHLRLQLQLGATPFLHEILIEISLNCKNFNGLALSGYVGYEEALAIATLLPKIKYLWMNKGTLLPHVCLRMILEGCKDLVLLDAKDCFGFEAEDEEILNLVSHIKTFMVEGSSLYDDDYDYDYDPPSYRDIDYADDSD